MQFSKRPDSTIICLSDDDPPLLKGYISPDEDGFYTFWPRAGYSMTCKELRDIASHLSIHNLRQDFQS